VTLSLKVDGYINETLNQMSATMLAHRHTTAVHSAVLDRDLSINLYSRQ